MKGVLAFGGKRGDDKVRKRKRKREGETHEVAPSYTCCKRLFSPHQRHKSKQRGSRQDGTTVDKETRWTSFGVGSPCNMQQKGVQDISPHQCRT